MRHNLTGFLLVGAVVTSRLALAAPAPARDPDNLGGTGSHTPEPPPGVATLTTPNTADLATASLSTVPKLSSTQFRASFVPLRALRRWYVPVLSDTAIGVTTDSSSSLTTLALTVGYDPFVLPSPHAKARINWTKKWAVCSPAEEDRLASKQRLTFKLDEQDRPAVAKAEAALVSLDGAAEEAMMAYSMTVAVVGLLEAQGERADSDAVAAAERARQKDFAARVRDDAKRKWNHAKQSLTDATQALTDARAAVTADEASLKALEGDPKKKTDACIKEALAGEWKNVNSGWFPRISVTGGFDIYPNGTVSDSRDTSGMTVANLEWMGGGRAEAVLGFRPVERVSADLGASYRRVRASGAPRTNLASYGGANFTLTYLVWPFLSKGERPQDPEYRNSGFIPGLSIGTSAQALLCGGRADCDKQRTRQGSITWFVDVRASKAVQFRLATQMVSYSAVGTSGTDIVPSFSIAGAVGGAP